MVRVTATQLCPSSTKAAMGDGKVMVWLCANKTLFTKMGAGPMDFPGGLASKTPRPQCWGPQVQSLVGELDPTS